MAAYGENTSVVVATEDYTQRTWGPRRSDINKSRRLVSEFAMVRAAGEWHGFRDVLEVDGDRVRDRDERLLRLFTSQTPGALEQGRRIVDEGARYNLGPIVRNFNMPTMALELLKATNQPRFRFEQRGVERDDNRILWKIDFTELARPTVIRTPSGADVPARGTIWVEPDTGAVFKTRLEIEGGLVRMPEDGGMGGLPGGSGGPRNRASVSVSYVRHDALGIVLPASMDEAYQTASGGVDCKAIYRDIRRFDTGGKIVGYK